MCRPRVTIIPFLRDPVLGTKKWTSDVVRTGGQMRNAFCVSCEWCCALEWSTPWLRNCITLQVIRGTRYALLARREIGPSSAVLQTLVHRGERADTLMSSDSHVLSRTYQIPLSRSILSVRIRVISYGKTSNLERSRHFNRFGEPKVVVTSTNHSPCLCQ